MSPARSANHGPPGPAPRSNDDDYGTALRKSQQIPIVVPMATVEDRVKALIEASGRTHREFAESVGLDAPKLSKSLTGVRRFSSLDLARIAEQTGESVDWLLTGERPLVAAAARAEAGSPTGTALREASRLTTLRDDLTTVGHPQTWHLPARPPTTGSWKADGASLAEAAGEHLAQRDLSAVTADLASVVEDGFGIDVAICDLGADFDGLSASTDTARLILLAPASAPFRQRFTLAHELGHLLASDDQSLHVDEDIERARRGESEVRANAFAAALLMPEAVLRERIGGNVATEEFCRLALDLRVSPSALAARLETLRLIDGMTKNQWSRVTAKEAALTAGDPRALQAATAMSAAVRPPGLLAKTAFTAYLAGDTTLRPYADLLGRDVDELGAALEVSDP